MSPRRPVRPRPDRAVVDTRAGVPLVVLGAVLASGVGGCDLGDRERAYVERLGADTMAVERYERTEERVEGDLVVRTPRARTAHYVATLGPEGHIVRLEVEWRTPEENPEAPPPTRVTVEVGEDSATILRRSGGRVDSLRVPVSEGVVPTPARVPVPVAIWEQAVRQALAAGGERYDFALLFPNGRPPAENRIVRRGADTVAMDFFGSPMLARIDGEGRILGITGRETTMKIEVEPVDDPPPLDSLAARWAAMDARGEGLGPLSPLDTVRTAAAGADIEVVYGRPSRRGRAIFGGLVPFGEVWRTGAGPATRLTVTRPFAVGDAELPAGSYSVWTTFTADSATLIVNEETGQWGTGHDPARDLVRAPMRRDTLSEPVERFTIELEDRGAREIALRLLWDTSRFTVPIRIK